MNIRPDRLAVSRNEGAGGDVSNSPRFVLCTRMRDLTTVGPISLFPYGHECSIRMDSTVTITLGMKDYGNGYVSPYFANLVATRLGVPLKQIRIYYAGAHPAVRITPKTAACVPSRGSVGPTNDQIGTLIESLCEQIIEQGRSHLAHRNGVLPDEIEFDATSGQFIVASNEYRGHILELARWGPSDENINCVSV